MVGVSTRHAQPLAGVVQGRRGLGASKETDLAQWRLIILERIKCLSSIQCVLVEGTWRPSTNGWGQGMGERGRCRAGIAILPTYTLRSL